MANKTQVFRIDLAQTPNLDDFIERFCDKKLAEDNLKLAATFNFDKHLVLIFQPKQS